MVTTDISVSDGGCWPTAQDTCNEVGPCGGILSSNCWRRLVSWLICALAAGIFLLSSSLPMFSSVLTSSSSLCSFLTSSLAVLTFCLILWLVRL